MNSEPYDTVYTEAFQLYAQAYYSLHTSPTLRILYFAIIRTLILLNSASKIWTCSAPTWDTYWNCSERAKEIWYHKDSKSFILIFPSSCSLPLHKNGDTKKVFLDPFQALLQAHSVRLVHKIHAYCIHLMAINLISTY